MFRVTVVERGFLAGSSIDSAGALEAILFHRWGDQYSLGLEVEAKVYEVCHDVDGEVQGYLVSIQEED